MTFKNKKKEILKKMSLQPDFGNYRSRLTVNGSRSYEIYVYTSGLSKSNQRAHRFFISKEICM